MSPRSRHSRRPYLKFHASLWAATHQKQAPLIDENNKPSYPDEVILQQILAKMYQQVETASG
jgi:hypothetical protein